MNFKVGDYFFLEDGSIFMLERINYLHEFSYDFCPIRPWIRVEEGKMTYTSSDYQRISLKYFDIFKKFYKMSRTSFYIVGVLDSMKMVQEERAVERLFLIERFNLANTSKNLL